MDVEVNKTGIEAFQKIGPKTHQSHYLAHLPMPHLSSSPSYGSHTQL